MALARPAGGVAKEVTDYFMMRIGIPNGIISSAPLRTIGGLTRKYARNLADITVRQNLQLHWLTIESLPEVGRCAGRHRPSPREPAVT